MTYPLTPGWRRQATAETSREAALAVRPRAPTQAELVLAALAKGPAHPEAITARIIEAGHRIMLISVRPRCSQLVRLGRIKDTGQRGRTAGGCKAIVWRLATEEERAEREAAKDVGGQPDGVTVDDEEVEAAMTGAGGWTREQLDLWGVPWPPPQGWRRRLTGRSA